MITTRQDQLETGRHRTSMDTTARLESGLVVGQTHICTDRRWTTVRGGLRVVAVDEQGTVLGFTGERTFRVGAGRLRRRFAERTIVWSSALFADSLEGAVCLEVVQFRPLRRGLFDRLAERA